MIPDQFALPNWIHILVLFSIQYINMAMKQNVSYFPLSVRRSVSKACKLNLIHFPVSHKAKILTAYLYCVAMQYYDMT